MFLSVVLSSKSSEDVNRILFSFLTIIDANLAFSLSFDKISAIVLQRKDKLEANFGADEKSTHL
jgi:hypothetical protein